MFFAVESSKQCEISVKVVETCPSKLASAFFQARSWPIRVELPLDILCGLSVSPCSRFHWIHLLGAHVHQLAARVNGAIKWLCSQWQSASPLTLSAQFCTNQDFQRSDTCMTHGMLSAVRCGGSSNGIRMSKSDMSTTDSASARVTRSQV